MALATTCPQCKTSFKVVPDQLKLRRGLVRCGACQHVFSGIDYLRYVDESKRAEAASPGATAPQSDDGSLATAFFLPETILAAPAQPTGGDDARSRDEGPAPDEASTDGAPPAREEPAPSPGQGAGWPGIEVNWNPGRDAALEEGASVTAPVDDVADADPRGEEIESLTATAPAEFVGIGADDQERPHAADASTAAQEGADHASDAPGTAPDASERSGPRRHGVAFDRIAEREADESAIDYFSTAPRGVGFIDRHGPIAVLGAALLLLALGVQWVIAQRSMIAARVPSLAPAIASVLEPLGLRIELPRDLESLTIESFELQASATPGVLAMSALLRNRADYAIRWPSMQLTLTDPANRVLVRKVLGPEDYLRESERGNGLPPRAEWPVRLALEANDVQPAGYSVILFYP